VNELSVTSVPIASETSRPASTDPRGRPAAPRVGGASVGVRSGGSLASQAAQEYLYVAHDIRRIIVVAGGLLILMLVIFVLVEVVHIFGT
jgi:hypothetical protein